MSQSLADLPPSQDTLGTPARPAVLPTPFSASRRFGGVFRFAAREGVTINRVPKDRDALFEEFLPLVHRLIGQYGRDAEMRQDLVGEIYFRFCALLDAYDPHRGVPLRPYLVRQLTASIFTYARRQWRQGRRESSLDAASQEFLGADLSDPTRQWDEALAAEQLAALLPEAVAHLSERQAQILIWRYFEELSYETIADKLNVQPATVRSLLRHALTNIKHWFAARPDALDITP